MQCRIVNKPYDIFGTWYSDHYLLSGDLHWLAHLVSSSVLWLNKASQETSSEHIPVMSQLYKFYNCNASSIRTVMIANCLTSSNKTCNNSENSQIQIGSSKISDNVQRYSPSEEYTSKLSKSDSVLNDLKDDKNIFSASK